MFRIRSALVVACLLALAVFAPVFSAGASYAVRKPTATPTPAGTTTLTAPTATLTRTPTAAVTTTPSPTPKNTGRKATATPTPASTATPTRTATVTPTATPFSAAACLVDYVVTDQWTAGFGASVTITNLSGAGWNGWQLAWAFPAGQTVVSLWNGVYQQAGATVTVSNASWNGAVPDGGTVNFGFNGSYSGTNPPPASFTLNGMPCDQAPPPPTPTPSPATPSPTPTRAATPGPTPTLVPGGAFPGRYFAPYVDTGLWPTFNLTENAANFGKFYTLAFMLSGGGCQAKWNGVTAINQGFMAADIAGLRGLGGDVIVSFGGALGQELAQACGDVTSLQAQYQAVIDAYGLTHVDFDIEGAAVADGPSVDRRNKAIAGLQATAQAQGKALVVAYTLPVMPYGLPTAELNLLRNAQANGVVVSIVNLMTMNYGASADPYRMGQHAIAAATNTLTQLAGIGMNARVGITPMIGLNDVAPEVFTLADAAQVLSYADGAPGIGVLSMWSAARDRACPDGGSYLSPTCSGISQQPYDFAGVWRGFTE